MAVAGCISRFAMTVQSGAMLTQRGAFLAPPSRISRAGSLRQPPGWSAMRLHVTPSSVEARGQTAPRTAPRSVPGSCRSAATRDGCRRAPAIVMAGASVWTTGRNQMKPPSYAGQRRAPPLRSLPHPALQYLLPMDHDQRQDRGYQGDHCRPDEGHVTVFPTILHRHLRLVSDGHVPRLLQGF